MHDKKENDMVGNKLFLKKYNFQNYNQPFNYI